NVNASGLRNPDAQELAPVVGATTARVLSGAFGLPMSGRSLARPSLFRSKPLAMEYGVPDWNVVIPERVQPPKGNFRQPFIGPGMSHKYVKVARCARW